jgi:hypothetical protein
MRFDLAMKPGIITPEDAGDLTIQTNDSGKIALIEYSNALPRVKLYSNWKTVDDQTALSQLGSLDFDPSKSVLVANDTPAPQKPAKPDADPGTVDITSYHPKNITMTANANTDTVLLFNERIGDHWNVWVDGKPSSILRCNYIMRGVFVPQGQHTIQFKFQPPIKFLYVSMGAFTIGLIMAGYVAFNAYKRRTEE